MSIAVVVVDRRCFAKNKREKINRKPSRSQPRLLILAPSTTPQRGTSHLKTETMSHDHAYAAIE
jgi:hypothetical protein